VTFAVIVFPGSNTDYDAFHAASVVVGAQASLVWHKDTSLGGADAVILPGGFAHGDYLRTGAIAKFSPVMAAVSAFAERGGPVLGICNGFQALVKAGLLPGDAPQDPVQRVTLHRNDSARFECRWVWLRADAESPCVFTRDLGDTLIHCPIAHGEGKVVARDDEVRAAMGGGGLAALRYVQPDGSPAVYPFNPNGSEGDIAGLTNPAGNVLGLMPHPEDHIVPTQHPRYHRGARGELGLVLFQAGVRYAASC
jgi:phosphoribosylformylglycinamidine synthase